MLLCYNYQNDITDEEKDIIFVIKPKLFSIGTINFPETIQSMKTMYAKIMNIDVKTSISKHGFGVQGTNKKIPSKIYEQEVSLQDI